MQFKGFVSDMDGVVADTGEAWYQGTMRFLERYGHEISREEFAKFTGKPETDDARYIKREFQIPLSEENILIARRQCAVEALPERMELNDGYGDLLDFLIARGVRISLASTSPRMIINKILRATGVERRFYSTFSLEETGSKVGAYVAAVKSLGLQPTDCFALEDSPTGARAAKEARLYCVVVPNPHLNGVDFSFADEVHPTIRKFLEEGKVLKEVGVA